MSEKNYDLWPGGPNAYSSGKHLHDSLELSYYYAKENEETLNPLKVAQGLVDSGTHEWYVKDNIIGVREIKAQGYEKD